MQAIFRLLENNRTRRIHYAFADVRATVRGQAMHEDRIGRGMREKIVVHLISGKSGITHGGFGLLAHAGPHIRVDRLDASHGFLRRAQDFDFPARFTRDTLGFGDNTGIRFVSGGRRDAQVSARARANAEQRMASVIAVADIGKLKAAQITEAFLECEEIAKRLARMIEVGQRIDNWNIRVRGKLVERILLEDAGDDAVYPALEAFRDIGNVFAFAEMRDGVIEKHGRAAKTGDAYFESNAGAQR